MNSHENVEQLLRRFMNDSEAQQAAQDIEAGDAIFGAYSTPAAPAHLVEAIQGRTRTQWRRQHQFHQIAAALSMAAAVTLICLAGIYSRHLKPAEPVKFQNKSLASAMNIWNDSMLPEMATIESELTDVAATIDSMNSEDFNVVGSQKIDLMELDEIELIASNTDFWKG